MFAGAQFVREQRCIPHMTLIKNKILSASQFEMPGSAYVGAYCIKSHLGSECGQNPLSTWRLTKKIMSAARSDMCAPLRRPLLQHHCLWADNLLSSPATCHPAYPECLSLSLSLRRLYAFTPRVKGLKDRAIPLYPAGLTLLTWIKDREPWGFSVRERRVPDYTPAKQTHTPHPITSLKTPPVSAHSFAS